MSGISLGNIGQEHKPVKLRKNKQKYFKCTCCGNDCDHRTTVATVGGINVLPDEGGYCDTCVDKYKEAFINYVREKYGEPEKEEA